MGHEVRLRFRGEDRADHGDRGESAFQHHLLPGACVGDAFYRSSIEPCASLLCGKLGGMPIYDPLEVAVREGRRHGLEVHAYLNALTGRAAGIEGQCKPMPEPDAGNPEHSARSS